MAFPAFVGGTLLEGPLIENGTLSGWNAAWGADRHFPLDMAAFALGLEMVTRVEGAFFRIPPTTERHQTQESDFLEQLLVRRDEVDVCASSHALAWHRKTVDPAADTRGTDMHMDV